MNPFIQNISKSAYATGDHFDCGDHAIAIEILDPCSERAIPKHKFAETYTFEFGDIEAEDNLWEFAIQDEQAAELVRILQKALEDRRDVIVHCTAGMCRSGAVVEVGIMMGFMGTWNYHQQNMWINSKMMRQLGRSYE